MTENREFQLPFRVLVHQKKGLEHGRSVVKFVNDALGHDQSALKVWLGGEKAGAVWLGNPPYEKSDLQKSDLPTLAANDLVFDLDDSNLKYPLLVYDKFAICSMHGIYTKIKTEPTHFYVYFLCMAIIGKLAQAKMGQPFPDFQPMSAPDWVNKIEGGFLPHLLDNSKTLLRNSEHKVSGLIDDIDRILGDINDYYAYQDQGDESDSKSEPIKPDNISGKNINVSGKGTTTIPSKAETINPPPKDLSLVNNAKKIDLILSDDMPELMGMAWLLQQKIEQATGKRPKTKTYRVSRTSLFYATLFKNKD